MTEDIIYSPNLEKIKLTIEQEKLMVQAIRHLNEDVGPLKKTVRWQFWFRQIWDSGKAELREEHALLRETLATVLAASRGCDPWELFEAAHGVLHKTGGDPKGRCNDRPPAECPGPRESTCPP